MSARAARSPSPVVRARSGTVAPRCIDGWAVAGWPRRAFAGRRAGPRAAPLWLFESKAVLPEWIFVCRPRCVPAAAGDFGRPGAVGGDPRRRSARPSHGCVRRRRRPSMGGRPDPNVVGVAARSRPDSWPSGVVVHTPEVTLLWASRFARRCEDEQRRNGRTDARPKTCSIHEFARLRGVSRPQLPPDDHPTADAEQSLSAGQGPVARMALPDRCWPARSTQVKPMTSPG